MIVEFYFKKKRNFEDNFSAKTEVDEWKQTCQPRATTRET